MRFLYLIPARSGSKGIIHKNTRLLAGKPLINYTIECVLNIAKPEDICISTDDEEIINKVRDFGFQVPFKRPAKLADDNATQYDVINHALNFYAEKGILYDAVVLLQPTSPFRLPVHILEASELYKPEYDMIVSVKKTDANPYYVLFEEDADGYLKKVKTGNYVRRQDCPDVWQLNGAIYVINSNSLKKYKSLSEFSRVKKYFMPELASIDIDGQLDWDFCEFLINKGLYV